MNDRDGFEREPGLYVVLDSDGEFIEIENEAGKSVHIEGHYEGDLWVLGPLRGSVDTRLLLTIAAERDAARDAARGGA